MRKSLPIIILLSIWATLVFAHEDSWWRHAPANEEGSTGYVITGDKQCGMGVHMWKIGNEQWIPVILIDGQLHIGRAKSQPDCQLIEYEE
jgi:hypothetical protein